MSYSVQQLATLSGITVRTLHYYDEIGLLKPSRIEKNGYRSYEEPELLKLQQILFFREMEFSLEQIGEMFSSPRFDAVEALCDQRKLIELKKKRLTGLIHTIDKTISSMTNENSSNGHNDRKNGRKITDAELYDAFKDDDIKEYQEEARQRWGNTDAYKQSMAKVSKMTKAEMDKLKKDGEAHTKTIAENMHKGVAHPDVQALIQKSYDGVNFFYPCSLEMFRNLGKMYVADPRYGAYYEKHAKGLAEFMEHAIAYYCDVREKREK